MYKVELEFKTGDAKHHVNYCEVWEELDMADVIRVLNEIMNERMPYDEADLWVWSDGSILGFYKCFNGKWEGGCEL